MRLLLIALALCAAPLRAEEDVRARQADAQAEYDLGHFRQSLELFEKLYKQKPLPGLLFNIAQCHRKLGELKEAANTYRSFLVKADPDSSEAQRARELLAEVEEAVRSQQKAADAPPHGTSPFPPAHAPVNAAPSPWGTPRPPAFAAPAPLPPPAPPSHKAAWVLGGIGVATIAAGAVFGSKSRSAGSELSSGLHSGSELQSLVDTKTGDAKVADLLFSLGGVFALGAVIAW